MLMFLLSICPSSQLLPIYARVLNTKAMHTVDLLIDLFKRRVPIAHKNLADIINAMTHMARL